MPMENSLSLIPTAWSLFKYRHRRRIHHATTNQSSLCNNHGLMDRVSHHAVKHWARLEFTDQKPRTEAPRTKVQTAAHRLYGRDRIPRGNYREASPGPTVFLHRRPRLSIFHKFRPAPRRAITKHHNRKPMAIHSASQTPLAPHNTHRSHTHRASTAQTHLRALQAHQ
jgi:hypothetical protein